MKYLYPSRWIICSCRSLQRFKNQIYFQSTSVSPKKEDYPLLNTKFNQYRIAYRYRRSIELLRGYLVYRLFSISFLVNNQAKVKFLKE